METGGGVDDILGELRAAGRLDSEGRFTLDTSRAEAAAIREIGSAEGALSPVGFGVIREALDPLLKELAAEHLTESVAWDYPVQQETNDARRRAKLREAATIWSSRLDSLVGKLVRDGFSTGIRRHLRYGIWYVAQAEYLRLHGVGAHVSWKLLMARYETGRYIEDIAHWAYTTNAGHALLRHRIENPSLDMFDGLAYFPKLERFGPAPLTSLPDIVRGFRAVASATAQAKAAIAKASQAKSVPSNPYEILAISAADLRLRVDRSSTTASQLEQVSKDLGLDYCQVPDLAVLLRHGDRLRGNGQRLTYLPIQGERDYLFMYGNPQGHPRPLLGFRWADRRDTWTGNELFLFRRPLK